MLIRTERFAINIGILNVGESLIFWSPRRTGYWRPESQSHHNEQHDAEELLKLEAYAVFFLVAEMIFSSGWGISYRFSTFCPFVSCEIGKRGRFLFLAPLPGPSTDLADTASTDLPRTTCNHILMSSQMISSRVVRGKTGQLTKIGKKGKYFWWI